MNKYKKIFYIINIQMCLMLQIHADAFFVDPAEEIPTPQYVYKVISSQNWERSQAQHFVELPRKEDGRLIHFVTADQVDKIVQKYWSHSPEYVILTIDTDRLPGKMIDETRAVGVNKYYHLYEGEIPLSAIVKVEIVPRE